MNVVRELGVNELGIYFYDHSNEPASELNSRMDGILAGVAFGDIVFVQSPSWNGIEWDRRLVDKLKLLQTKLVMFIHDVPPLMFESNYYLMPNYIDMYNQSDLVVVPSEQMYHRLVSEGLTVKKYVVQKVVGFDPQFGSLYSTNLRKTDLLRESVAFPTYHRLEI